MPENITFRNHLLTSIKEFANTCSMGPIVRPAILVELIVALARYKEEGVKLLPEVYLCADINKTLKLLPDHGILVVGQLPAKEESIKSILKKCAPLAIGGWCIYIEGRKNLFTYGLFRDALNPLALPIEEVLLLTHSEEIRVVKVHQTAEDCVEIRNYRGNSHNIFLSHKKESAPSPTKFLYELVTAISDKVDEHQKESVRTFLNKSLRAALSMSHGTLIAVSNKSKVPKLLADGISLNNPIDFAEEVIQLRESKIQPVMLSSQASLLSGMLNCDGIVVFGRDAKLLAYNCFISSSSGKSQPVSGGARRRAFDALCNKLGRGICAVFIQSQDGWTEFRRQ